MYIEDVIADDHFLHAESLCQKVVSDAREGSLVCDAHCRGLIFGTMRSDATSNPNAWQKGLHHHLKALRPIAQTDRMAGVRCFREVLRTVEELSLRLPNVSALTTIRLSLQMYELLLDGTTSRADTITDYKVGIVGGEFAGLPSPVWY